MNAKLVGTVLVAFAATTAFAAPGGRSNGGRQGGGRPSGGHVSGARASGGPSRGGYAVRSGSSGAQYRSGARVSGGRSHGGYAVPRNGSGSGAQYRHPVAGTGHGYNYGHGYYGRGYYGGGYYGRGYYGGYYGRGYYPYYGSYYPYYPYYGGWGWPGFSVGLYYGSGYGYVGAGYGPFYGSVSYPVGNSYTVYDTAPAYDTAPYASASSAGFSYDDPSAARVEARRDDGRESARGELRLSVSPDDASVYVDDRFLGSARQLQTLSLAPGAHRIEVVRPGYRTTERTVEVGPDGPATVVIEMER